MFKVIKMQGKARRGVFTCAHGGQVQTPVFMNVGTQAAIKGGVSALDLKEQLGTQIELSNTYHLHLRPGDDVVRQLGGLHKFMRWDGPILTDSGGFQVFSLAGLRKISEEGVTFASHLDGHRIFMGPEESMRIQSNLGSDIAMAFDECVENPAPYDYAKASCERTLRWLARCKAEHDRLNALPDTINPRQLLFGINQGATYADLRIWHMQQIAKIDCDGFAIGGLQEVEDSDHQNDHHDRGTHAGAGGGTGGSCCVCDVKHGNVTPFLQTATIILNPTRFGKRFYTRSASFLLYGCCHHRSHRGHRDQRGSRPRGVPEVRHRSGRHAGSAGRRPAASRQEGQEGC